MKSTQENKQKMACWPRPFILHACYLLHGLLEPEHKAQVSMQTLKTHLRSDKCSFQIIVFLIQFNPILQMEKVSLQNPVHAS